MSYKSLAVESARYHNRMAVRGNKYFFGASVAYHRQARDNWMKEARK